MKKHFLFLSLSLFSVVFAFAQTQQGYVRTIGRSGKPGQPVNGVMIKADGPYNMVLSDAEGKFSLLLEGLKNGDAYRFASVRKSSYELLDNGTIGRQYGLSSKVPVEIVLVNKAEKEAEKAAIAERFQAQAMALYEQKVAELEAKHMSAQQKDAESRSLEEMLEKLLGQIDEQAEYYATRDYDRMDSLDQVIVQHIEKGEFDKAEQLIHSKGSIEDRMRELLQKQSSALEAQKVADKAQQLADAAAQDASRTQSGLEQDLMNLYQMAKTNYQNDTAYYYITKLVELSPENVDYLNEAGVFACYTMCRMDDAMAFFEKSINISVQVYGEESAYAATAYENRGYVYCTLSKYEESLADYRQSLQIRLKLYGEEHLEVAAIYNNIGTVYLYTAKYPEALEYCSKALNLRLSLLGEDNILVSGSYYSMGQISACLYHKQEAMDYYQKSLQIRLKLLGEDNIKVASCYFSIGVSYAELGQYETAMTYYEKALKIQVAKLGKEHLLVADTYTFMGDAHRALGRYDEAMADSEKALQIRQKLLGKECLAVANCYYNMGNICTSRGQYDKALKHLNKSVQIADKVLGEDNLYSAIGYNNIAAVYTKMGKYDAAIELYRKILPILSVVGYDTASVENDIAYCYAYKGEYDKALEKIDQVLGQSPLTSFQDTKGEILYMKGDYEAAYTIWLSIHESDPDYPQHDWAKQSAEKMAK